MKQIPIGFRAFAAAFGAGSVWVSLESDGTVVRVSPRRNRVVKRIRGFSDPNGLVYANGAIWVSDLAPRARLADRPAHEPRHEPDRRAGCRLDHRPAAARCGSRASGAASFRLDPVTRKVVGSVAVGANPLASAWVDGALWVPNIDANTISVVDPATNTVSRTVAAGNAPLGVAATAAGVFVSMSNDGSVWRFAR